MGLWLDFGLVERLAQRVEQLAGDLGRLVEQLQLSFRTPRPAIVHPAVDPHCGQRCPARQNHDKHDLQTGPVVELV